MADEGVCAERMRGGEETRERERGAEINHLTSGWSVHLCLRDRLQIGCDIQEHLGGHGSACFSLLNPLTQTHTGTQTESHGEYNIHVQRGIPIVRP